MVANNAEELFSSSLNLISLQEMSLEESKARFADFQKSGIIRPRCEFDDEVWYTTDEYSNVSLHFEFNMFSYKQYEDIFHATLDDFIVYTKMYLISIFGKRALSSMQLILLDLRHIVTTNIDSVYGASDELSLTHPNQCADFFSIFPTSCDDENIDRLIDAMDSYAEINFSNQQNQQRTLADFDTYFIFNDIIKEYWKSQLSDEDQLFYYPLYLWWVITAVVPLRPREFLLTQRNCLARGKDGSYELKLRRNQLKGANRGVSYKLSEDYSISTYKVPDYLGKEIEKYLRLTDDYDSTDIDTLFITDPHFKKWGQSKRSNNRFLTYVNMNTILRYFFREIINERYGLNIINDSGERHLNDQEIRYIRLGDTRHIALINLMQEGGTPAVAMLLAVHTNKTTAAHYYSNLESLIECKTQRMYRKLTSGNVQYQINTTSPCAVAGEAQPLSDGGKCYSKAFMRGEISDCLNTIGDDSEIGYCPNCIYYRKNEVSFFGNDNIYRRNIEEDCKSLVYAMELVRQHKGSEEGVGEALLRLRSSSTAYENYCLEKLKS